MTRIIAPTATALILIAAFSDAAGLTTATAVAIAGAVFVCALAATIVSIVRTPGRFGLWLLAVALCALVLGCSAIFILDLSGLE